MIIADIKTIEKEFNVNIEDHNMPIARLEESYKFQSIQMAKWS